MGLVYKYKTAKLQKLAGPYDGIADDSDEIVDLEVDG
jgi:hypothetical protein